MLRDFSPEQYFRPGSVEEAVALLAATPGAGLIAGGTDLLVRKPPQLRCLVDVAGLGLGGVERQEGWLRLAAGATATRLEEEPLLAGDPCWNVLREAAALVGTPTVRSRATLGGNLSNASPAADMSVAALALGAEVEIAGPEGVRRLPLEQLFAGVNRTRLAPAEILTVVYLPAALPDARTRRAGAFLKLRRQQTSVDIALVNAGVVVRREGGVCTGARIALGAVAETPMLALEAAASLCGRELSAAAMREAGEVAAQEARPIDDIRASAEYRREMVAVLVRRALETATGRCSA